jgi:two-component system LytT family response regulator
MIKAVIIDDEPQSLKSLVIKLGMAIEPVEILAAIEDPEKAISLLPSLKPDVVFTDIEMPVLNGFQMLKKLGELPFEIVFTTAYNAYILDALRISALDYLLKPIDKDELNQTLLRLGKKMLLQRNSAQLNEQLLVLGNSLNQTPSRLALATSSGLHFVKIKEIIRVEALSNYSTFHLINKQKIIVSKTLKEFEPALLANNFMRVNRSSIINIECVSGLRKSDGGSIIMQDGTEIDLAPNRRHELMEKLNTI